MSMSKVLDGIVTDLKCLPQKLSSKTKDVDIRKAILMNMPYISIGYVADLVSRIYRTAPGEDASQPVQQPDAGDGAVTENRI